MKTAATIVLLLAMIGALAILVALAGLFCLARAYNRWHRESMLCPPPTDSEEKGGKA